jgi:hypothetical protein
LSNLTAFTRGLVKFVPVIVTVVPTGPLVGVNEVIVGAAAQATPTPTDSNNTQLTKTMANSLTVFPRCGSCIGLPLPDSAPNDPAHPLEPYIFEWSVKPRKPSAALGIQGPDASGALASCSS